MWSKLVVMTKSWATLRVGDYDQGGRCAKLDVVTNDKLGAMPKTESWALWPIRSGLSQIKMIFND